MIVELFPCSGGMAEGFRRAGLPPTIAFERDADACSSYEANQGHAPVRIDVRDLLRMTEAGWRPAAQIDLVVADPPCTPWSRAGKRMGTADERDMLLVTVELIRLWRPRTYLIGNVPGLDDSTNWPTLQRALAPLAAAGYCIADYATLDAADFGVPQHRVRPFWFGHLEGPCIRWPAPTHGDPEVHGHAALPGVDALTPWVTCRQALEHLPAEQLGTPVRLRQRACNGKIHGSVGEKPARVVGTTNLSDGNVLLTGDAAAAKSRPFHNPHPCSELDEPARTLTTRYARGRGGGAAILAIPEDASRPEPKRRTPRTPQSARGQDGEKPARTIRATRNWGAGQLALQTNPKHPVNTPDAPSYTLTAGGHGRGGQGANVLSWPWDRASTVVTTRGTIPPPGHHPEAGSILTMPDAVRLSETAGALLQGFPPGWVFSGRTKTSRWSQLGQAMPPALAEAVARAVALAITRSAVG